MTENATPTTENATKTALGNIWSWVKKHKLATLVIVFFVHLCFIDKNNYIKGAQYSREISELQSEIQKYQKEYKETKILLEELNSNPERIEKIAREKYFMKKPNEEIYIFDK